MFWKKEKRFWFEKNINIILIHENLLFILEKYEYYKKK